MMPYITRLRAFRITGEPVAIIGLDAASAIIVTEAGTLEYVDWKDLRVPFFGDAEMDVWWSLRGETNAGETSPESTDDV